MSFTDDAFEYEPLEYDHHDFRLLKLSGSQNGEIDRELYHAAFDSEPYEALSYTWGGPELVEIIKVNNKTLRVTGNLYAALLRLQVPGKGRVLWIDAICIDQTSEADRSRQVSRMRDVFGNACQVIVWLGKATLEIDKFMSWLRQHEKASRGDADARIKDEQILLGARTLLRRPWFNRVWIIQEIANARSSVIYAGGQHISASLFAEVMVTLEEEVDPHCLSVLNLMQQPLEGILQQREENDLAKLLLKFQKCKASDERDKIYALRGLSTDLHDTLELYPDYSQSTTDVVGKAVRYLFEIRDCSIDAVLAFLSSFTSLSVVCLLIAPSDPSVCFAINSMESVSNLLTHQFDRAPFIERSSFLQIEQQDPTGARWASETCYSEIDSLSVRGDEQVTNYRTGGLGSVWNTKSVTWVRGGRNIKVLLIQNLVRDIVQTARFGCGHTLDLLVEVAATWSGEQYVREKALDIAIQEGEREVVELLIERGTDLSVSIDATPFDGPLHTALRLGHEEIAELLIKAGAKMNTDSIHGTALHIAVANGLEKIVQMLLERGADVNYSVHGDAVFAAILEDHEKALQLLIDAGAKVNVPYGCGKPSPLRTAASFRSLKCV